MIALRFRPSMRHVRDAALLAACYFACAAAMVALTRFHGGVAIVWLATAPLFAMLCVTPRRRWWLPALACLAASALATALFGLGPQAAAPLAFVNVAEGLCAAMLTKRFYPRFGRFHALREVVVFVVAAGLIAPALSGLMGAAVAHAVKGTPFWPNWRDWFAGHALGLIAFAPPLVVILRGTMRDWLRAAEKKRRFEGAIILGAVTAATLITFGQSVVPLVVLPLVAMLVAAFRLGRFGALASIVILLTVGTTCSLLGAGPINFIPGGMSHKLQVLQLYLATVVLILLPVAAELTARERRFVRVAQAESFHRLILEQTSDLVMRLDCAGRMRYVSPSVRHYGVADPTQLLGRRPWKLLHPEDIGGVKQAIRRAIMHPGKTVVVEFRTLKDGGTAWLQSHLRATIDENGQASGVISIAREVTEARNRFEDLQKAATSDGLTGVANRRAFDQALRERLAQPEAKGCLALFDLDHFKRVNDRHGHDTGDLVLQRFAELLRTSVRDGDFVARLGGEEFAVVLAGADVAQSHAVCSRIRERLEVEELRSARGEAVRLTVSVGIAEYALGAMPKPLYRAADEALYRAKESGRNRLALAA